MKFLSKKQVRALITLSYSSIDRMEANGCFPFRIRLGQLRVVWREDQVLEWMREVAERGGTLGNSYIEEPED